MRYTGSTYRRRVSLSNIQCTFLYSKCLIFPTVLVHVTVVQYTVYFKFTLYVSTEGIYNVFISLSQALEFLLYKHILDLLRTFKNVT